MAHKGVMGVIIVNNDGKVHFVFFFLIIFTMEISLFKYKSILKFLLFECVIWF